jgi:hypothetical protein
LIKIFGLYVKKPAGRISKITLWLIEIMCAIVPKASALGSDPLCDAIGKKKMTAD